MKKTKNDMDEILVDGVDYSDMDKWICIAERAIINGLSEIDDIFDRHKFMISLYLLSAYSVYEQKPIDKPESI